jgi:hypothetical protein
MVKVIVPPDHVPEYGPPEVDEESNVSPEGNVPFAITMVTGVDTGTPAPPKVLVLKVYTILSPTVGAELLTEPEMLPERAHPVAACATGVERTRPPVKKTEPNANAPKSAAKSIFF